MGVVYRFVVYDWRWIDGVELFEVDRVGVYEWGGGVMRNVCKRKGERILKKPKVGYTK